MNSIQAQLGLITLKQRSAHGEDHETSEMLPWCRRTINLEYTLGSSLEYRKKAMIGYNGQKVSHYAVHGILGFLCIARCACILNVFILMNLPLIATKYWATKDQYYFFLCLSMYGLLPALQGIYHMIVFFVALGKKNVYVLCLITRNLVNQYLVMTNFWSTTTLLCSGNF